MAPFANFVNRFHKGDVFWDMERPCQSRCFSDPSLAFISISTSHFITKNRKEGEFGEFIQDQVVSLLEQDDVKNARFRIGLIHHKPRIKSDNTSQQAEPKSPFEKPPDELALNSRRIGDV
jgi:hypothetical protein